MGKWVPIAVVAALPLAMFGALMAVCSEGGAGFSYTISADVALYPFGMIKVFIRNGRAWLRAGGILLTGWMAHARCLRAATRTPEASDARLIIEAVLA